MSLIFVLDTRLRHTGVVNLTLNHARAVASGGHRVLVLALPGDISPEDFDDLGAVVIETIQPRRRIFSRLPTMLQLPLSRRTLRARLAAESDGVIVASRQGALLACLGLGLPVWHYVHQSERWTAALSKNVVLRKPLANKLFLRTHRLLNGFAAGVLYPSASIRAEILHDSPGRTVHLIPPIASHSAIAPRLARPLAFGTQQCPVNLLWVGRFEKIKNAELALIWLKQLLEAGIHCHLTMVGDGPELVNIVGTAHSCPDLRIDFLGRLTPPELAERMRNADALLVTSFSESYSLVALEAIQQGCLVMGRPVGILSDLAEVTPRVAIVDENLRPDDVVEWLKPSYTDTAAISQLLKDQDEQAIAAFESILAGRRS